VYGFGEIRCCVQQSIRRGPGKCQRRRSELDLKDQAAVRRFFSGQAVDQVFLAALPALL